MTELSKKLGFTRKAFVSNLVTERLINEIMELRGSNSRSQIIRDAIFEYRKSTKGFYLDDSPAMEAKRRAIEEKERFNEMSDEEYAKTVIKGLIFPNSAGIPYVVMHWFGNTVQARPVEGCKEWFSTRLDIVDNHLNTIKVTPIEEEVKKDYAKSVLKRDFDIITPDDKD